MKALKRRRKDTVKVCIEGVEAHNIGAREQAMALLAEAIEPYGEVRRTNGTAARVRWRSGAPVTPVLARAQAAVRDAAPHARLTLPDMPEGLQMLA